LTHAVVLVIVITISGYASVSRHLSTPVGARSVDANAFVMNQGGQVNDLYLGRFSTIIKPLSIPTAPNAVHAPSTYVVQEGEDLSAVATRFGLTVAQVRWSNAILSESDRVTTGVQLVIPPLAGVVVATKGGESLYSIAESYKVDAQTVIDFNRLLDDPNALPAGLLLVLPGGIGPEFPPPAPTHTFNAPQRASVGGPMPVTAGAPVGTYTTLRFPYGYCTYYVATRRPIPWLGDAWAWYGNAQAMGYPTGSKPRVGAVMVTWESPIGHVAYVESVNADGSWVVSEMNFRGFAITSQRTIRPGQVPLIGFVYG